MVVGSLGVRFVPGIAALNALTGRGYIFTSRSPRARLIARILGALLRRLLRRPATLTLLENEDDRRFVVETFGVPVEQTAVNRGSGIDLAHFTAMPMPNADPVTIACAARMLTIKGVADLAAASRILTRRGIPHRLLLAGDSDPENPDAIAEATLRRWASEDGITWLGHVADIRDVWREADIAALASHGGEGIPLSLVEAAACGRPLVAPTLRARATSRVPGSMRCSRRRKTRTRLPTRSRN